MKKSVIPVIVLLTSACLFVMSFMHSSTIDKANILSSVTRTTQGQWYQVTTNTIKNAVNAYDRDTPLSDSIIQGNINPAEKDIVGTIGVDPTNMRTAGEWFSHCKNMHKEWQDSGYTYGYGVYLSHQIPKDESEEKKLPVTIRIDCSGYVSYCLYRANIASKATYMTSSGYESMHADLCAKKFQLLTKSDLKGYESLKHGDIIFYVKHVEIVDRYDKTTKKLYVLNWGGESSAEQKGNVSITGHGWESVTAVWRWKESN